VTGSRGKKRRKLLDDLKERRGYSHLKEEALDRPLWRARFGRGFGPVVRQTTIRMILLYTHVISHISLFNSCLLFFPPLSLLVFPLSLLTVECCLLSVWWLRLWSVSNILFFQSNSRSISQNSFYSLTFRALLYQTYLCNSIFVHFLTFLF